MPTTPPKEGLAPLSPLLTESSKLAREAVKRRKPIHVVSITSAQIPEHEAGGWELDRTLKRLTRMKREKAIDERLENRCWMLLYRLGYPEMNEGRQFTVEIERKGAEPLRKQIDVFAKDDETVIVAECKASEKLTRRSLQKDIEEFANLKGPIANAIRKHYGVAVKLKVIFLFITENIIWSAPDKQRAVGENIGIVTERELRYYAQIGEHLGKAARYQFLAEFLKDQAIPELSGKSVPAIRGRLGGKHFFTFVTTPRHLLKISFVNHRSLNDPEGAPSYQRLVSKGRLRAIGEFIRKGGYFPNNLIISFTRKVRFDKISRDETADVTYGQLYLPDRYRTAWIIDGQHRLYGFSPIDDKFLDQNVIVVAFEQLPKAEEANLFVTINHEQKPVPKHLLDDLEGELKWGSKIPSERIGAVSARLINLLNADVGEAFYNRITQQGITSTNRTCLTIPALKDAIRRSGLVGRAVLGNSNIELGALCGKTDVESLERARSAINQFFGRIRNAKMVEWESGRDGVLCTNVAVQAYILLLGAVIDYWEANTASDAKDMEIGDLMLELEEFIEPVTDFLEQASSAQLREHFSVPFGSGGPPEYFFRLSRLIKSEYADFQPEGLETWEAEQSEERIGEADQRLKTIVSDMRHYIFSEFRQVYGEKNNAYWEKGVSDRTIKSEAYSRSLDTDSEERLALESYLEVVEMKKIIESKENWPRFKDVFNIPEPGEKGLAKNTKWMVRINELRRIPAHPARERHYKVEDFEYIEFVYQELMERLQRAEQTESDGDHIEVFEESDAD
jgi:DNA sulfur modification protein DndB